MSAYPFAAGAFGKLPAFGDFVREGDLPEPKRFSGGSNKASLLRRLAETAGANASTEAAQKAFVFPLNERSLAVGVMAPSQDAVGRRFPFSVFHETTREHFLPGPHVLPLYLGNFLQASGEVIDHSMVGHPPAALLQSMPAPDPAQFGANLDGYSAWIQSASLRTVGQAIFRRGLAYGLGARVYVCAGVGAAVSLARKRRRRRSRFACLWGMGPVARLRFGSTSCGQQPAGRRRSPLVSGRST